MSAICGLINLSGINKKQYELLTESLEGYHFDKKEKVIGEKVFMEEGLQYVTKESLEEQLPFQEGDLYLVADAIIDNREELMNLLHMTDQLVTDSQIILKAYEMWGKKCGDHLIGDFAFAIWDAQQEELFCIRDHVGKRSVYYSCDREKISFATMLKPLIALQKDRIQLNEKWLADYLSIDSPLQSIEINETPYEHIYELPPAHYLIFSKKGILIDQYWHPEKIKPIKLGSEEAYEKALRDVLDEAVKCRLRSIDKVGIMLSSGLDSTAVCAMAARKLEEQNKTLESFTEVPLEDYKSTLDPYYLVNESELVKEMVSAYPNIHPHFSDYKEENAYKGMDENISLLDTPYKFVQNFYWVRGLIHEAKEAGCKVLLDGQFGNHTISQGSALTYWNTLFKHFRWVTLLKEMKHYCKVHHVGRKVLYKHAIKLLVASLFADLPFKKNKSLKVPTTIVNKNLASKWHCLKRMKKAHYLYVKDKILDEKEFKAMITNLVMLSHIGNIDTSCSIETGLQKRDPTMDKRVIEFCLSVPQSQYVYQGDERSLIKRAMSHLVPDKIRLNDKTRGKQAADWLERLTPYQQEMEQEVKEIIADDNLMSYLDREKLEDYFKAFTDQTKKKVEERKISTIMYTIVFSRFIKRYLQ